MKKYVLLCLFVYSGLICAQVNRYFESEQRIAELFREMRDETDDQKRKDLSEKIEYEMLLVLQNPTSFDYPFDSLTSLGKIYSDDRLLRVYTWNVPLSAGKSDYGGIVQRKQSKGQPYSVTSLKLISDGEGFKPPVDKVLSATEWYGALYYRVIAVKAKKRSYYVLLGWSSNDDLTNFKVIEPLSFDSRGRLFLGRALFRVDRKLQQRVLFEYGSQYNMTLDYDRKNKQIVFDHLAPSDSKYQGIYAYYGPDFTYDAYVFKKNRWQFTEEVDMKNAE